MRQYSVQAVQKNRMVELWSNEEETGFGIRIAGEKWFKATTGLNPNALSKLVDSSPYFEESSYSWPYTLSRWVYSRYRKKVKMSSPRKARVAPFSY